MMEMEYTKGARRFAQFLLLLETLALAPDHEKRVLVSEIYSPTLTKKNVTRIEVVKKWIIAHLTETLMIKDVASRVNMEPKSFSYFFKKNTGKSFVQYVKELRIGLACQKLLTSELSILEVAYGSGFNNLSNFNRQFREIKGVTPTQFRKQSQSIAT